MRARGLDETKLAGKLNGMLNRLSAPGKEKLQLDVFKECGKILDVYPSPRGGTNESLPVQIVAHVPRPERDEAPEQLERLAAEENVLN